MAKSQPVLVRAVCGSDIMFILKYLCMTYERHFLGDHDQISRLEHLRQ